MKIAAFIAIVATIVITAIFLSTLIFMFFLNIVLAYFGLKLVTFWVAFAICAILSLIGSVFRASRGK